MGEGDSLASLGQDVCEVLVGGLAHHLDDLVPQREVHRTLTHEGEGVLGAPPVELLASVAPVATLPLAQCGRDVAMLVDMVDEAQWELPADLRLPVEGPSAACECRLVEGAPRPGGVARPVEHDACVVGLTGDGVTLLIRLDRAAGRLRLVVELPFVGAEFGDARLDTRPVGVTGEVGPIRAAALLFVGGGPGEDAGAPAPEDAVPVAGEEGQVEQPGAMLVGGLERQPFVEVLGGRKIEKMRYIK